MSMSDIERINAILNNIARLARGITLLDDRSRKQDARIEKLEREISLLKNQPEKRSLVDDIKAGIGL